MPENHDYLRLRAGVFGVGFGAMRGIGLVFNICRSTVSKGTFSSAYSERSTGFAGFDLSAISDSDGCLRFIDTRACKIAAVYPRIDMIQLDITDAEIDAMLAQTKYWSGDIEWVEAPRHSAFYQVSSVLLDDSSATIPGINVELQYRVGTISDDCKFKFTIFWFKGKRNRAFQIEVVPPEQPSHTENGVKWFGPHMHVGSRNEKITDAGNLGCTDHEKWFRLFLKKANIQFSGRYTPPESQLKLGL